MQIPTEQILDRISAIQARLDSLTETPPQPAMTFASTLQSAASGAAALPADLQQMDPNGELVRPLTLADTNIAQYDGDIQEAAARYGLDPHLLQAVMEVESGGNPRALSKAGAMGLMQLMPADAAQDGITDPYDPAQNIDAGARQLSQLLAQFGGNLDLALAGYNAGPNAVTRYGGIPPYAETQNYVRKVRAAMDSL